jgi:hypothetical protein
MLSPLLEKIARGLDARQILYMVIGGRRYCSMVNRA